MDQTRKFFRCCEKILLFFVSSVADMKKTILPCVPQQYVDYKQVDSVCVCQTTIQNKNSTKKKKRLDVLLLMHTQTRMLYEHRTVCGGGDVYKRGWRWW